MDDLEQVLQSVNIPRVHTITDPVVDIPQQQIPLVVAESSLESPINTVDPEEVDFLSMPLIENVDNSQTSDTPTNSQITASSVTVQSTVAVKPYLAVNQGKDIENLCQQYTSPGLLDSSSEIELSVSRSSGIVSTPSTTQEPRSVEATPSTSRTSYYAHSSTSQFDASESEQSSSSASRNRSRSRSPRPPGAGQRRAQEPFHIDDLTDHFEWQLLHGRVRLGSATVQEIDRFVHLDQSLRSQLQGVVNDPADMSHE